MDSTSLITSLARRMVVVRDGTTQCTGVVYTSVVRPDLLVAVRTDTEMDVPGLQMFPASRAVDAVGVGP